MFFPILNIRQESKEAGSFSLFLFYTYTLLCSAFIKISSHYLSLSKVYCFKTNHNSNVIFLSFLHCLFSRFVIFFLFVILHKLQTFTTRFSSLQFSLLLLFKRNFISRFAPINLITWFNVQKNLLNIYRSKLHVKAKIIGSNDSPLWSHEIAPIKKKQI